MYCICNNAHCLDSNSNIVTVHTTKACGGIEIKHLAFLILTLGGDKELASCLAALCLEKDSLVPIKYKAGWSSQLVWIIGRRDKSLVPTKF